MKCASLNHLVRLLGGVLVSALLAGNSQGPALVGRSYGVSWTAVALGLGEMPGS